MYNQFNQKPKLSIKLGLHFLPHPKKHLVQLEPWQSNHQDPLFSPGWANKAPPPKKKAGHDNTPWHESPNFIASDTVYIYIYAVPECL